MARTLYLFAVRDYPSGPRAFSAAIDTQLDVARTWWSDPALGDRALTPVQPGPLKTRRDVETAVHDAGLRDLDEDDIAVLYVTGHGTRTGSGRHYLLLPDTPPGGHLAHGYPTADLVTAALSSQAKHVLVIVNSCFAGELDAELALLRKDLPDGRRLTSLGVVTTADFDEMPRAAEFADVLAEPIATCPGRPATPTRCSASTNSSKSWPTPGNGAPAPARRCCGADTSGGKARAPSPARACPIPATARRPPAS